MNDTDRRQAIMYLYEKSVVQLNTALQEVSKRTLFSHEIVQGRYNFFLLQAIQYEDVISPKNTKQA